MLRQNRGRDLHLDTGYREPTGPAAGAATDRAAREAILRAIRTATVRATGRATRKTTGRAIRAAMVRAAGRTTGGATERTTETATRKATVRATGQAIQPAAETAIQQTTQKATGTAICPVISPVRLRVGRYTPKAPSYNKIDPKTWRAVCRLMRLQQQTARSDAGRFLMERRTSYSVRMIFRLKRWFAALKVQK